MTFQLPDNICLETIIAWSEAHTLAGPTHGAGHWHRVADYGQTLCDRAEADGQTPNRLVVLLFAYLHDSQRQNDGYDCEHGPRAAEAIPAIRTTLLAGLTDDEVRQLQDACRLHTSAHTTNDLTINICLDSDRLDLDRVGFLPDPKRMASAYGAAYAAEHRNDYLRKLFRLSPEESY